VEVCWTAHHAEVWHLDAAGRRYRGVAYRRWPDDRLRLFEVRSWNYAQGAREFAGDEPTFRARVNRDPAATITAIDIRAVLPDGRVLQTARDWPDWPERTRPTESLAVPAVGGWPRLAGMTGRLTVRSGPATVPARFPWRPPQPLRPRYVSEMVTEGTRFRTREGRVLTVNRIPAGTILLPSGTLLVADPGWLDGDPAPLAATVAPGEYPVEVFQASGPGASPETVACRVTVTGAPVASWHLALRDGDHELALGDGELFGNPIDGATFALLDRTGAKAYHQSDIEAALSGDAPYRTISAKNTNMIIVPGWSDGSFPVWLGRAQDGTLSCYVLDFLVLATAQPA
jgi:hypothetical protein